MPVPRTPALFTRISSLPKRATVASIAACHWAASVTSSGQEDGFAAPFAGPGADFRGQRLAFGLQYVANGYFSSFGSKEPRLGGAHAPRAAADESHLTC